MAQDRGRKGKSGRKSPEVFEETMQVRVRRKNPLIERKVTDQGFEDRTAAAISAPPSVAVRGTVPRSQPPLYSDDDDEDTHTTQEVDLGDALRAQPRDELDDEDMTEIADGPPQMPAKKRGTTPKKRVREKQVIVVRSELPALAHERDRPARSEGAIPRDMLGKWGTDAVGAAAQQANIARLAAQLPEVNVPALKLLRGELAKPEIYSLERALAGEHDARNVEPSMSPKRTLEHLINEPSFNELHTAERAKLLKAIAADPRDIATTKSAIAVLKTGVARRLRAGDREKLFALFVALDSETRALLARLAARALRGKSALEDRDFEDVALIAHLHGIAADRPLARELDQRGVRRARVLSLLLGAIANPERLPFEEGGDGVLGMLEFGLADGSPAELTRLWTQLVSGDMCAQLAGQERLDLGARVRADSALAFSSRDTPLRVGLELLVSLAHPRRGPDRAAFVMPGGHGVDADIISRALSYLYGVGFTVAAGAPTALRHLERVSKDSQRVPPVFVTLLYERGERLFVFDRLAEDGALLRAPHGRSTKRRGAQRTDPDRIVEDPDLGLDKVPREALQDLIGVALVPRT